MAEPGKLIKTCMVGGGSYGTAIARIMAVGVKSPEASGIFAEDVKLWVRRQQVVDEINTLHTNTQYADGAMIPSNVLATASIADAVGGASVVVLAVPHQFLDAVLPEIRENLAPGAQVVSLIKGFAFDQSSGDIGPLSASLSRDLGGAEVSALMGPTIYSEMLQDQFAEATIGYRVGNEVGASLLHKLFSTPTFAVTLSSDLMGVELCGGLKNCITLGCGFCVGLGLGMNTKSALMRAGQQEIVRLCRQFFSSVSETTFSEACGIGDLILSCSVGRGQRLAAAFVKADPKKSWEELEDEILQGQKIPDWHNIKEVHIFLEGRKALDEYPLIKAIYEIAYDGAEAGTIVSALRRSLTRAS